MGSFIILKASTDNAVMQVLVRKLFQDFHGFYIKIFHYFTELFVFFWDFRSQCLQKSIDGLSSKWEAYSETRRKWLLAVNYFCKTLYLRCLIGFWIHLWKLFNTPEIKKLWFSGIFWYNRETLTRNGVKQKSCDSLIL